MVRLDLNKCKSFTTFNNAIEPNHYVACKVGTVTCRSITISTNTTGEIRFLRLKFPVFSLHIFPLNNPYYLYYSTNK